jgi:hypothetical protein
VAEIWRGASGGKKAGRANANAACAVAEKITEQ